MNSETEIHPIELKSKVQKAINKLFKNDNFLLTSDVNERSISHKLAEYLQQEFDDWNVDCEYNRDQHSDIKRISNWKSECLNEPPKTDDLDAKTVYPDIIIHHRNTRNNLLLLEIKKSSNTDEGKCDIEKLKMFIKDLNYHFGLFINFKIGETPGLKSLKWLPIDKFRSEAHD